MKLNLCRGTRHIPWFVHSDFLDWPYVDDAVAIDKLFEALVQIVGSFVFRVMTCLGLGLQIGELASKLASSACMSARYAEQYECQIQRCRLNSNCQYSCG